MIVRKQQIKLTAEEVSMQVSFSLPDIKRAMQKLYSLIVEKCGIKFTENLPWTELDLLYFLEHDTFCFFPQKYREQLSAWAFEMCLRHKFILSGNDDESPQKIYFLSQKLRHRIGRPREMDDED